MKKLLFAVSALAALSLLAPSVGFAQDATNQLGIYVDANPTIDGFNSNVDGLVPNDRFTAHLVLTNPVNTAFDGGVDTEEPITAIDAFECRVVLPAASGTFLLTEVFPPTAIGATEPPEYAVAFGISQPVVDNAIVLITWTFFSDGQPYEIFLEAATAAPRFPGNMSLLDANDGDADPGEIMYPANGDFSLPAFGANAALVVPVENESWGDVKALFR